MLEWVEKWLISGNPAYITIVQFFEGLIHHREELWMKVLSAVSHWSTKAWSNHHLRYGLIHLFSSVNKALHHLRLNPWGFPLGSVLSSISLSANNVRQILCAALWWSVLNYSSFSTNKWLELGSKLFCLPSIFIPSCCNLQWGPDSCRSKNFQ